MALDADNREVIMHIGHPAIGQITRVEGRQ